MASPRSIEVHPARHGCLFTFLPTFLALGLGVLAILFFGGVSLPDLIQASSPASASHGAGKLASFYAKPVMRWSQAVTRWAETYDLDPNLVATVIQIESCGDSQAVSSAGAAGLFQVMPFHFAADENPTDPSTNARRGLEYLKQSLEAAGGDVRLALAGYNGGIGVISQPEWSWPAETRRYADWGSRIYAEATRGEDSSQTLQEWLSSGGSYLCQQATR